MASEKQKKLVSAEEEQDISRKMMVWANSFSDEDMPAATINYEFLPADSTGSPQFPDNRIKTYTSEDIPVRGFHILQFC
jgi:hypothetical protein